MRITAQHHCKVSIMKEGSLLVILIFLLASLAKGQNSVTGELTGKVIDRLDRPVSGAVIYFKHTTSSLNYSARTNDNGVFHRMFMEPGEYEAEVLTRNFDKDYLKLVTVRQGTVVWIRPEPPIFSIGLTELTGRIINTKKEGVEGVMVRIHDLDGKLHKDVVTADKTDGDGNWQIKYLKPGRYLLIIDDQPRGIKTVPEFRLKYPLGDIPLKRVKPSPTSIIHDGQPHDIFAPLVTDRVAENLNIAYKDLNSSFNYRPPSPIDGANIIGKDLSQSGTNKTWRPLTVTSQVAFPIAQDSSRLNGRIIDTASNGLPDATVTAVDETSEDSYAAMTDKNGNYEFTGLPDGSYTIAAYKEGYDSDRVSSIQVKSKSDAVVAPPIKLIESKRPTTTTASKPDTVSKDGTSFISGSNVGRNANFDEYQMNAIPLGGNSDMRSFDELALLAPGVAPPPYTPGVRGPGVGFGVGTSGKFSVNGMRARSNNFSVDGSDNNDPDIGVRRQGFIALVPQSIESIKELQILTLLWDAELGRNFGSQVNAVTKYGGKSIHGQAYGFLTDSRLNARNFFDNSGGVSGSENPYTRSQAGGVIGGPLPILPTTHFFSSFEHLLINTSVEQHFSSPTADERRFLGRRKLGVLNPLFEDNPNIFFKGVANAPLGRNILKFYPLPNNAGGPYGDNTYTEILPASGAGDILSSKITHLFADNKVLNVRYNFTNDDRVLPSVNQAIRSSLAAETRTQNLSLILNSNISARVFNQARFSYGRTRINFLEYRDDPFTFVGGSIERLNDTAGNRFKARSQTGNIGELIIDPFSAVGVDVSVFPQQWIDNTFQYADTLAFTSNKHIFKLGFDIKRIQLNSRQERNYRSKVVFSNAQLVFGNIDLSINNSPDDPTPFKAPPGSKGEFVSGIDLATIGLPSSIFQTITLGTPDPTIGLRYTEFSLFFNDNWRMRTNFTLDYGVRYEYTTVPHEVNDRIERALRLETLPMSGSSRFDTAERRAAFDAAVNAYSRIVDGRDRIYDPDTNNFGPHIGFVWIPPLSQKRLNLKTAIRGGYGIYFDAVLGAVVSQSRNVFPTEISLNVDPSLGSFDVLNLSNPGILEVTPALRGNSVSLIAPGTKNQLGGMPQDAAALIGDLFLKNKQGGGLAFTLPSKNLPTPYAQQWHLTLENEIFNDFLVSAAYVGTKGTNLTRLTTPNLGPNVTLFIPIATTFTAENAGDSDPSPLKDVGLPPILILPKKADSVRRDRPIPELGAYQIFENSANSNYHALQIEARKRYSHGYTLTIAYTWSHAIDDVSDIFSIAGAPTLPQNSFNFHLERASANFDIRHRIAVSSVWDLPFFQGANDSKARWLGGWQIASILQAYTGQPFTLNVPADANLDGNLTDRPSTINGLIFFEGHGPRRVTVAPDRKVTDFFVFERDGVIGRNAFRGDSFLNLDIALNKNFVFSANKRLQFRTEFFNAFNRANFGLPIRTIGAPGFGTSVETINLARIVQFGVKLSF